MNPRRFWGISNDPGKCKMIPCRIISASSRNSELSLAVRKSKKKKKKQKKKKSLPVQQTWILVWNRRNDISETSGSIKKRNNCSVESQSNGVKEEHVASIDADLQAVKDGRLTEEETIEAGSIPLSTYMFYIRCAGGFLLTLLVVTIFTINIASTSSSSWWLAHWLDVGVAVSFYHINIQYPIIEYPSPDPLNWLLIILEHRTRQYRSDRMKPRQFLASPLIRTFTTTKRFTGCSSSSWLHQASYEDSSLSK